MHTFPTTTAISDFSRLEDIAAAALQMGRCAAALLSALPPDLSPKGSELVGLTQLLTSDRLFAELGLATLEDLERQLNVLVHGQTYFAAPYGWQDAEGELTPERRVTDLGRQLERVRDAVAEAMRLARFTKDLARAETIVGRARGLLGAS